MLARTRLDGRHRRGRGDPDRRRAVPDVRRATRPTATSPSSATCPPRWRCSSVTARPAAGRAAAPRPLRRRPADDPQVPRQDQRGVHQAAAQRHRVVGQRTGRRPAAAGARPDVRARHHPQPGADERLARLRARPGRAGLRRLLRLPAHLAEDQAPQALRRGHARCAATGPSSAADSTPRSARPRRSGRPATRSPSTTSTPTPCTPVPCTRRRRWTRSSPTPRTASSTAAGSEAAGSRAARSTCCARPCPSGPRCCAPAARWASRGTPTWPARDDALAVLAAAGLEPLDDGPYRALRAPRRPGDPAGRPGRSAAGLGCPHGDREAGDGRGTTRPSCRVSDEDRHKVAEILRQAAGDGPHRPRRARRAARGDLRRQDLRRPRPHHRRPAEPRAEQPAGAAARDHCPPPPATTPRSR